VGFLCRDGISRHRIEDNSILDRLGVPRLLACFGGVRRLRLSPEGYSLREMCLLTKTLVRFGVRIFLLAFHSPSLEPGHTPYVRSRKDAKNFKIVIENYLSFFSDEIGGAFSTPHEIRTTLINSKKTSGIQELGCDFANRFKV
jgi:hypothetical protein